MWIFVEFPTTWYQSHVTVTDSHMSHSMGDEMSVDLLFSPRHDRTGARNKQFL